MRILSILRGDKLKLFNFTHFFRIGKGKKGDYNLKVLVAESNFINADTRHMNFNFIAVSD